MTTPKTAYQKYLADPDLRGRIDRQVARLRSEAMWKFLAAIAHAGRPAVNH